ncbi:xanthine dehydrogenase [Rhodococcus jostii RHA1] [Mycobacterium shimoidei]|uniref:Xanthine dehydrogenase [Rhodococcus jostii RHA1] n=1 Tax=Mycobacterium shimoidei TaxID=29313 RepID=A0A375YUC8_MYCSH|nr:xanthine dehydrogenase [Rhodococcus jostii RHA1] [Mycobacterium shimoidei]
MPSYESAVITVDRPTMRDVLAELTEIWRTGPTAGLATAVRTIASSPRPPGAAMIIARSWGGGCHPLTELDGRIHHDRTPG